MAPAEFIELTGGIVTRSTTVSARGAYVNPAHLGQMRFFLSHTDDRGEYYLWDGASYDEAIRIAEKMRRGLGVSEPVRDTVMGASNG